MTDAMIEAMARAMSTVIANRHGHPPDYWMGEHRREEAQAALEAAEPFIQARIDEAVKAEREACKKIANSYYEQWSVTDGFDRHATSAKIITQAIRARGDG